MTRKDIKDHIRMETNTDDKYIGEGEGSFCKQCGANVNTDGQHIVHHVPEHGGNELHTVHYCGVPCFREHMDYLFDV